MKIWVDADACPKVIKEILFRAAERSQTQTTLIANHSMRIPPSPYISHYQVTKGFDEADDEIVKRVAAGDIVISSDIPLAADAIKQGATVLSPRGERYTSANIQARLTMRDFMETMRASGLETSGPDALNHADRKRFADQLDQLLQQRT